MNVNDLEWISEVLRRRLARLVELGIVEKLECSYENCLYETREFGEGPRRPCVDHIVTRAAGGADAEWNWQVMHIGCNSSKASREDKRSRERKRREDWEGDRRERSALFVWIDTERNL